MRLLQLAGEPDVVGVGVGQDDRFDVVDRAAHVGQGGLQGVAVSAQAGVDERDLAVLLEQEEVPEFRSQRADHRWGLLGEPGQVAVVDLIAVSCWSGVGCWVCTNTCQLD